MPEWIATQIETLIALWKTRSETDVAKIMGMTRNAVAGKLNRLRKKGMELEHDRVNRPRARARKNGAANLKVMKCKEVEQPPQLAPVAYHEQHPCSQLELDGTRCHFPIGDPRNFDGPIFCGGEAVSNKPYCPYHCRLAYNRLATQLSSSRAAARRSEMLLQSSAPDTLRRR